ncbi:MAG: winged helix-turn-helix transcriptional regulator [Desulfopila sp.]
MKKEEEKRLATDASLSEKVRKGDLFAAPCPSRHVLKHVCSQWGVLALMALREHEVMRFSELRRKLAGVSEKMLAQSLQALVADGFVSRKSYAVVPPRVEYRLTPMGEEIAEHVANLADWIECNMPRVMEVRRSAELETDK